jgi:hypothetical protein
MCGVKDAFGNNRARNNVIICGAGTLICGAALFCVSPFLIYRAGFRDLPSVPCPPRQDFAS